MSGAQAAAVDDGTDAIRVDDLTVEFRGRRGFRRQAVRAIDNVTLALRQSETLALVGESGCGKSTLVRTIFGLNPAIRGSVQIFGHDTATISHTQRRELRKRVQMVFQDPYSSLNPHLNASDIVAEPLRINGRHDPQRVLRLLEQVGLGAEALDKKPREFSGGQRQRLGIARALALDPDVLVLDEPVSALDVSVQAQVLNLLSDLQDELGLSYLFIAHDLSVIRHIAHEVAVMHLGRIVEKGSRDEIFERPRHPYTRALLESVPVPDPHQRRTGGPALTGELPDPTKPPSGCTFRTRCPFAQDECSATEPSLSWQEAHPVACHFPLEPVRPTPETPSVPGPTPDAITRR